MLFVSKSETGVLELYVYVSWLLGHHILISGGGIKPGICSATLVFKTQTSTSSVVGPPLQLIEFRYYIKYYLNAAHQTRDGASFQTFILFTLSDFDL